MGRVYLARQVQLGRLVALKVLHAAGDPRLVARFEQEARAVASLRHPHIAQLHEFGTAGDQQYLIMEFVSGGSLADRLAGKTLPPRDAAGLVALLGDAMQHAHDHGILHRDLKPANILLAVEDPSAGGSDDADPSRAAAETPISAVVPKVADFGLAKRLEDGAGLTQSGDILGTPSYMAPEQAAGSLAGLGPATDLYALGAILYECLTGRPPFLGPEPFQVLAQVLQDEPVPVRGLQPGVPKDLETICLKCLEKAPPRRYPSAGALAQDLRRFLAGEPIVARPIGPVERMAKWSRRRPWQATALALLVLLILSLGLGLYLLGQANTDLKAKRREADEAVRILLADLGANTFELSDQLEDLPQAEQLRRDLLARARQSLNALDQLRPTDPTIREAQALGYHKLAHAETRLGQYREALAAQTRAWELSQALARAAPGEAGLSRLAAQTTAHLAILHGRLGDTAAQALRLSDLRKEVDALLARDPQDLAALELRVTLLNFEQMEKLMAGDRAAAERLQREVLALRQRLEAADPAQVRRRALETIHTELLLAGFLGSYGRESEAEPLLAEATRRLDAYPEPGNAKARKLRGWLYWTRGDVLAGVGKAAAAETEYQRAFDVYAALAADFPKSRDPRLNMAQVLWHVGLGWKKAGQLINGRSALLKAEGILRQLAAEGLDDEQSRDLQKQVELLLSEMGKQQSRMERRPGPPRFGTAATRNSLEQRRA